MSDRTAFEASLDKKAALKTAEASGQVADNMDIRRRLIDQIHSGEITLAEAQKQLKKIQNGAASSGHLTRAQAYNQG